MKDIEEMQFSQIVCLYVEKAKDDDRLGMPHFCLLFALLHASIVNGGCRAFYASRSNLMAGAKIKAKTTYHKCLDDLVHLGYLKYQPSFHPKKGSLFYLKNVYF